MVLPGPASILAQRSASSIVPRLGAKRRHDADDVAERPVLVGLLQRRALLGEPSGDRLGLREVATAAARRRLAPAVDVQVAQGRQVALAAIAGARPVTPHRLQPALVAKLVGVGDDLVQAAVVLVQHEAAGEGFVLMMAGDVLGDLHDAARRRGPPTVGERVATDTFVPGGEEAGFAEVADVHARGDVPDRLDLLGVADDQCLLGEREGSARHLRRHLSRLVDDQQVGRVVEVVVDVAFALALPDTQQLGQHMEGGHGAGREHHPAAPARDHGGTARAALLVGGISDALHGEQPLAFPVMRGGQEDREAQQAIGERVAVSEH